MNEIAVAHKDYDVRGGGEILAETLAEGLDAPLIVGHSSPVNLPDRIDVDVEEIGTGSKWHWLAGRGGLPRAIAHMMLWRDHAPDALDNYDVVVSSGNEPQWWMPREEQTWVAYTHSTPRWMYDLYNDIDGWLGRTATQVKRWVYEQDMSAGPDLWVANSDIVARRMQRYWNIPDDDIRVVYPPVETERLGPDHAETEDYYLALGRLAEVKGLRQIVRTANELELPLKVVGDGPLSEELRALAGPTVTMYSWVDGESKCRMLAGAKALINNSRNEDFGMVPIEAIASGTPVLTVAEGMPQHSVLEPECGLTFERGDLASAIDQFERDGVAWSAEEMAAWAHEHFSTSRFISEMREAIATAEQRTTIEPGLRDRVDEPWLAADGGDERA